MTDVVRRSRAILSYAALLALGTAALQWFDWQRAVRSAPGDLYIALVALGFVALGLWAGWQLARPRPQPPAGQAAVAAALGISAREQQVLDCLARGLATKQIARALGVSPNTVKTHLARLFEKLPAANRTAAIARARSLGLLA